MDLQSHSWTGRRVAVTGATGFIGYHLCRLLTSLNADVTVLIRASSDTSHLAAMGVRSQIAPLEYPNAIAAACRGHEFLFHLAGAVDFSNDWEHYRRVNVEGTANVLHAAARGGVQRVVHASSIVAIGASREPVRLNEDSPWNLGGLRVPYVTTKHESELIAVKNQGEPDVVIVNPASVIGPGDFTGSEFGLLCRRFWQGRIPFVFGGGTNFVDVRDVAAGMLAAAERGRPGARYILGGSNRSYTAFFSELAAAARRPITRFRLPTGFARAGAAIAESLRRERRKRPLLTASQAKLLGHFFYYDCAKAARELGYRPRPLGETIADTHEFWMVKRDQLRRATRAA